MGAFGGRSEGSCLERSSLSKLNDLRVLGREGNVKGGGQSSGCGIRKTKA